MLIPTLVAFAALSLSTAEKEEFLSKAKLAASRTLNKGVTASRRVTLVKDDVTHDAHVQAVDMLMDQALLRRGPELQLRDSWMYNVAAYRLSRLLGMDTVPVTVERRDFGGSASVTWWIDYVLMDEGTRQRERVAPPDARRWAQQMESVRLFDQLIYNLDRNIGNLIISKDWKLWMIDHSRSFRLYEKPPNVRSIFRCERTMYERLRALDEATLRRELRPYLTGTQIRAVLSRRDEIVKVIEERRREYGDDMVLYELPSAILHANLTN